MRGLREPLLWIALASFVAFLPVPQLAMPVSAALALATLLLLRTRVAQLTRQRILFANCACWSLFALNALCLLTLMMRVPLWPAFRAAELGMPLVLWMLAGILGHIADVAVIEDCAAWFRGLRPLLIGWFLVSVWFFGAGVVVGLLVGSCFALLVLQMRSRIPREIAR